MGTWLNAKPTLVDTTAAGYKKAGSIKLPAESLFFWVIVFF